MEPTIQKKPNRWIVHDDTGAHEFATEKEVSEMYHGDREDKEEEVEEDE